MSAQSSHWHFEKLVSKPGFYQVPALLGSVHAILTHPLFSSGLADLLRVERPEFKQQSNEGFVWQKRRHVDCGNVAYCVLFQMLSRIIEGKKRCEMRDVFDQLVLRYPSLNLRAEHTERSMNLKGDVIEFLLAKCRETGPMVDADLIDRRISFNRLLVQFAESYEGIIKMMFHAGTGWPLTREMPYPDLLVKLVLFADNVSRALAHGGDSRYSHAMKLFQDCAVAAHVSVGKVAMT